MENIEFGVGEDVFVVPQQIIIKKTFYKCKLRQQHLSVF